MPKAIVVCLDGTWNENETQSTNVLRICEMLDKSQTSSNYYSGIGVGGWPLGDLMDGILGRGVFRRVREAFTFVRNNYRPGDEIFIFGFSRGAYAARHLAGLISRMGLGLPTEATYDQYREALARGEPATVKQAVKFLGMFDCVPGNQVYLLRKTLASLNDPLLEAGIQNTAHGVSRDERRWSFKPLIFRVGGNQTLKQVLLPGYHFDVGGDANGPLNSFALWWMLREAYGHGLPLQNIKCPNESPYGHHGRIGIALGFMADMDSEATGRPKEYFTTRLGLRCERSRLPGFTGIEPKPDLMDLDICPRGCQEELFEPLLTAEGKRRLQAFAGGGLLSGGVGKSAQNSGTN